HRRHAPFHVAGAASIKPAILDVRPERFNRHVVGWHGVLMGLQHQGKRRSGRVKASDDVLAERGNRLTLVGDAEGAEEVVEVSGDLMLVNLWALQGTAHRIDAGPRDKIAQQAGGFVHGGLALEDDGGHSTGQGRSPTAAQDTQRTATPRYSSLF